MIKAIKYGKHRIIKTFRSGSINFIDLYFLSQFRTRKKNIKTRNYDKSYQGENIKWQLYPH